MRSHFSLSKGVAVACDTMRSHFSLNKGAAVAWAVAGTAAMLNGNCAAQSLIAADYATNSAYASGWSPSSEYDPSILGGQNGGYGFGPWTTYGTEAGHPNEHALDRTSPYDPWGVAWTLFNPEGTEPNHWPPPGTSTDPNYPNGDLAVGFKFPDSPGTCFNGTFVTNPPPYSKLGTDVSRAGRALPNGLGLDSGMGYHYPGSGLQVGETFSTIISNPTDRGVYRGYTIVLSNFPENIGYAHDPDTVLDVGTFEYGTHGRWYTSQSGATGCSLFDTNTAAAGMQLDVTVTSTNGYHLVMTPLDHPELAYTEDGIFRNPGPIVWVTYQLYGTDSNFYTNSTEAGGGPGLAPCGPDRTDFYIKSMTVSGLQLSIQRAGTNAILSWPAYITDFNLESTPSLSAPAWNLVSPDPVIVNGQNVVTNAIAGAQLFYRLHFLP